MIVSLPLSLSSTWGASQNSWYPQPLIVPIEVLNMDMDHFRGAHIAKIAMPCLHSLDSFSPLIANIFRIIKIQYYHQIQK